MNPFTADVDGVKWHTRQGEHLSLREMAGRTTRTFWPAISALGDPLSLQLIAAVMRGRAPSLLELDDRPEAYDDVGRLCKWNDLFPVTLLPRSRYERVLSNAIAGHRVRMSGAWHRPVGMKGWTHVVFRREKDGARRVRSLDDMLTHLDAWDRTADRRVFTRRVRPSGSRGPEAIENERRKEDRRSEIPDTMERRRESDREIVAPPSELADSAPAPPKASSVAPGATPRPTPAREEAPLIIVARNS
jgi:hypothetical protein